MKSLQLLLFLTPLACLLAQAPPASQPANPPAPAGQPARPPAGALQPPAPAVAHVPPETVVLTIGEEKIIAADLDRMIDMLPEQYRAQMRTPASLRTRPPTRASWLFRPNNCWHNRATRIWRPPPKWTKPPRANTTMSTSRTMCR